MKERTERWAAPALSFLLPGLVMLAVSAVLGMAPWGDNTILISDMSTQYVEFFCALKNGTSFSPGARPWARPTLVCFPTTCPAPCRC